MKANHNHLWTLAHLGPITEDNIIRVYNINVEELKYYGTNY